MPLIERMSTGLLLPTQLIRGMASKASHTYKEYRISKRGDGYRVIHHPSKELKALQRWLLRHVIMNWEVHNAAFAYRKKRNIRDNAIAHVKSNFLLRLDLKDFFPSITSDDVNDFISNPAMAHLDWTEDDRLIFLQIVCRFDKLSIGAPTSPALSNALCFDLDTQLSAVATELDVTYTRYADDLFFSTKQRDVLRLIPQRVRTVLDELACPSGLQLREDKTRHSSKKGRRRVTGLMLGSDEQVYVGRARKRYIRRQIHRWEVLKGDERMELAGNIAFGMSIDRNFVNTLILKYGRERIEAVRRGIGPEPKS